ncbi:glucosaminidase domain-containing protein, partial [Salmonella enterica]|nr:glucosaminidase domain-containing protein [Salmonella enterica]
MSKQSDFINRIAPAAQRVSQQTGIPASVIMAQAALESGWGTSQLSAKYNNFFGVKGQGVALPSPEYENGMPKVRVSSFKVYNSIDESLLDYAKTLQKDRYKKAFM